ncbi:MAG: hypothetical protein LBU65_17745 [Planctomycetaceae bacterium]|jgi:ppGpp synthetase/RelA/SpoT-type nucleotidyltranferase|nr:hypothetical protein [Planctomycetaceae bacterium]
MSISDKLVIADIDRAGDVLVNSPQDEAAIKTLNQWQFRHACLLNEIRRQRVCAPYDAADLSAVAVSARPKRMSSIVAKLLRISRIKLSEMQDIAGMLLSARR